MKKFKALFLTGLILALLVISSISAFASDENVEPKEIEKTKTTSSAIFDPWAPLE